MQGDIEHVTPLTIDAVSRIHFRGGSHIGISRANPTSDPKYLENVVISLLRLDVTRAPHDRRRRHGVLGDEGRRARARPHPRGARAEDDRQRSRSAADGRHVRFPDRPPLRRRDREEPHGGREDHVALVLRDHDGTQSRPSGAWNRQGRRRDAHADSGGVPEAAATEDDRRHACRRDHQAPELRTAGWRRDDCRRRRARCRPERSLRAARSRARCAWASAHRRGEYRRDPQGAGRGAAEGTRREDDDRGQEHRLRAPVRRSDPVRHGVRARSGLLRGQIPAGRRQCRHGLDAGRPFRADPVLLHDRSRDGPHSRPSRRYAFRPGTRSRAVT